MVLANPTNALLILDKLHASINFCALKGGLLSLSFWMC